MKIEAELLRITASAKLPDGTPFNWAGLPNGTNRYTKKLGASSEVATSKEDVAKLLGVSKTMIDKVRIAKTKGGEHFVEAIKDGKITVDAAYNITRLPKAKHEEALQSAIEKKPRIALPVSVLKKSKDPGAYLHQAIGNLLRDFPKMTEACLESKGRV